MSNHAPTPAEALLLLRARKAERAHERILEDLEHYARNSRPDPHLQELIEKNPPITGWCACCNGTGAVEELARPRCGVPRNNGHPCLATVTAPGDRCHNHKETTP